MTILENAKKKFTAKGLEMLLNTSARVSDEDLIKLTYFAENMAKRGKNEEDIVNLISKAREEIIKGHPWVELGKRAIREIAPSYRRIIVNFFLNSIIWSVSKRREIKEKEGVFPPFSIVISPSMRCNLHCRGCYAWQYKKEDDLPLEIINRVITEGKELGIYFYTISGGEPFYREDLMEIYKKHNDVVFHIYTNGTRLDEEHIQKLVELGNVIPLISIEGSKEETDARRGKGTYEKVMQAMDNLKKAGVPFGASITHTSLNTQTIVNDKFADFLIKKGVIVTWFFQYIPIGQKPDLSLIPTAEDRELRRKTVLRWRNEKPMVVYDFWNDGPLVNGCIAGGRYLHIIHNGDVEPCVFVHFAVDNIKNKSLKETLTSPFFKAFQKREPYMDKDEKEPNLLRPCSIIDHPYVLREIVKETGAHPTCKDAEKILVGTLARGLDRNAEEWKKISFSIWQNEKEYKKYH